MGDKMIFQGRHQANSSCILIYPETTVTGSSPIIATHKPSFQTTVGVLREKCIAPQFAVSNSSQVCRGPERRPAEMGKFTMGFPSRWNLAETP